jgi:hypothetical protein
MQDAGFKMQDELRRKGFSSGTYRSQTTLIAANILHSRGFWLTARGGSGILSGLGNKIQIFE